MRLHGRVLRSGAPVEGAYVRLLDGTGEFITPRSTPVNEDYFMVKVDHQFSATDSFFVRYSFDQADRPGLEHRSAVESRMVEADSDGWPPEA